MQSVHVYGVVAALLVVSTAYAQDTAEAERDVPGWSMLPAFEAGAVYDDNLFSRSEQAGEVTYTRLTGSVDTNYRGATHGFGIGYSVSSEIFPERFEELTTFPSRQQASVDYSSQFNPRTSWQADARYLLTHNPNEIVEAGNRAW